MPILPPSEDGQPGLMLKNDVIDHLGSGIIFAQLSDQSKTDSSAEAENIVALAATNSQALERSLAKLHSQMLAAGDPQARRELLGHTIYLIDGMWVPFLTSGGASRV